MEQVKPAPEDAEPMVRRLVLDESNSFRETVERVHKGREPDEKNAVFDASGVSRTHGEIYVEDDQVYYKDLVSRNGSKVDGEVAEPDVPVKLNEGYSKLVLAYNTKSVKFRVSYERVFASGEYDADERETQLEFGGGMDQETAYEEEWQGDITGDKDQEENGDQFVSLLDEEPYDNHNADDDLKGITNHSRRSVTIEPRIDDKDIFESNVTINTDSSTLLKNIARGRREAEYLASNNSNEAIPSSSSSSSSSSFSESSENNDHDRSVPLAEEAKYGANTAAHKEVPNNAFLSLIGESNLWKEEGDSRNLSNSTLFGEREPVDEEEAAVYGDPESNVFTEPTTSTSLGKRKVRDEDEDEDKYEENEVKADPVNPAVGTNESSSSNITPRPSKMRRFVRDMFMVGLGGVGTILALALSDPERN